MTEDLLTESIPAKFKDPETGEVRIGALAQSYKDLEKKLSQSPKAPSSPEDYCIECAHGLFTPDPDVNAQFHQMGLSNEQAQGVYDLAAQKLVPAIHGLGAHYQADRELEKLINYFGGADAWKQVAAQLLIYGQRNLQPQVLENLASSYDGVVALYRMMKSDEPGLKSAAAASAANPDAVAQEKDLQSMMRDPRYWREKDPAFVAKVTDGFKKMYSGKK